MKNFSILITVLYFLFNCKQPKEVELNDPEWRKESLDISSKICSKLESCVQDDFSKIKKSLQNYAKAELKSEKCIEKNKKSRVYLLKGTDPSKIKQAARDCYSQILKFSCEEIRYGGIKSSNPCEEMRQIQQGK